MKVAEKRIEVTFGRLTHVQLTNMPDKTVLVLKNIIVANIVKKLESIASAAATTLESNSSRIAPVNYTVVSRYKDEKGERV